MLEAYPFNGSMNLDDPDLVIPKGMHRTALNGIFRGVQGQMRFESVVGTNLVPNAYLPNTGSNMTIGAKYDPVKQRLFFFNWNSKGSHAIYMYDTIRATFSIVVEDGVNTQGDVLAFDPSVRIHSIDIIYGDANTGDLLFFVDSLGRPRKLNIDRLLNNGYAVVKDAYLKVAKAPPFPPPQCVYENDATVVNNNLVNSLFNFSCTHIYDDFEESVLGGGAKQPLPSDPFDPKNNTPAYRNARIRIYVPTGDQNVTKIRIYGKQVKAGVTSDWFIIDTLVKADLTIPDNTVYQYIFKNDGNYPTADPAFTTLDFDRVPLSTNCQGLLNGNVIAYGACTEGYNFINPSFGINTINTLYPVYSANGVLFFAYPNGQFTSNQPQITIYLSGVATNDAFGNPQALEKSPTSLVVRAKSNNTAIDFSYNNVGSTGNIPTLLNNLRTAAVGAGWVYVSNTTNSLTLYYPSGNVVVQSVYYTGINADTSPYAAPQCSHFPQSAYAYGVIYRDADGRTNGVISNVTGNIQTQPSVAGLIPQINIGLGGFTPPTWAVYYEIVRTDNLTYDKYLSWVSTSAFSDIAQTSNTQYAYFGISNIDYYNLANKATEGVIGYSFTPGDRIKVTARYDVNEGRNALNFDYAIVGLATNPIINGQIQLGNFIQIAYPAGDIGAGYKFDGTQDFQQYEILIYSYKAHSSASQEVFYQIGYQFPIGNPGTLSAFHIGNVGDNQVNLTDGDVFYRTRTVPITNTYFMSMGSYAQGDHYDTIWSFAGGTNPLVDNGIWNIGGDIQRPASLDPAAFPTSGSTGWIVQNKSANAFSVRFRGTITAIEATDPNGTFGLYAKVVLPGQAFITNVIPEKSGLKTTDTEVSYTYDITISLPPGAKVWLIAHVALEMYIGGSNLQIDIIRNITLPVWDYSFSDIYNLKTNSDNKPSVIDKTAKQTFFSTLFRYSEAYQPGTNINNTNRFYPNNFDEFDKSFGSIQRIIVRQREARIFQQRRCGRVGIYQKFVRNNEGETQLIVSDTIITPNNIQYFEGEWGIGNQPSSLSSSGYADYFADPVKGYFCRLSLDGIIPISELYKVQTFSGANLPNYLHPYNYQFGGIANILSVYNFLSDRDGEAIFCMQGGGNTPTSFPGPGSSTVTFPARFFAGPTSIGGFSLAFDEAKNAWTSFYSFVPDSLVCCENLLYSFYNGQMYTHNNTNAYANFYGTQYNCSITGVYKDPVLEKKTFTALTEISNAIWECPLIYTNTNSYGSQRQESNLVAEDFALLGADYNAGFWFDIHSQNGLVNGDLLQANLIVIQFNVTNPAGFVYLSNVSISFIDNRMTSK